MRTSRVRMTKGIFHTLRGMAKVITGRICSNTGLVVKGKVERITGTLQWKLGKTQAMFGF